MREWFLGFMFIIIIISLIVIIVGIKKVRKNDFVWIKNIIKALPLIGVFLVIFSMLIIALEAYTEKELIPKWSLGDCRIANISKALELKDASIIVHRTKAGTTHVIAIDSNNIVYDLSTGGEENNGTSFLQYKANKFEKNIYTAVLKNEKIVDSTMNYNNYIKTYLSGFYVYVSIYTKKIIRIINVS